MGKSQVNTTLGQRTEEGAWGQRFETPEGSMYTPCTTLETTQGKIDGFFSQLQFKCYPQRDRVRRARAFTLHPPWRQPRGK